MTGFQARSRSGRWSWTLKLAQKRPCAGSWSWASEVGLLSLQVVPRQQCNGHCLCDCPPQQLKQPLRGALVAARQWRRDTALTLPLFWRRSFSGGIRGRAFTLSSSPPPPTPPQSLISILASVDVKQNGHGPLKPRYDWSSRHCPRQGLLSCCFTSTEARWPIRDVDRAGNRPKKTGETVDRRQNNGSVKAVSPRHCPATCALCNCCFNCCAGQNH